MLNVYRVYIWDNESFDITEENGRLSAEVVSFKCQPPVDLFWDGRTTANDFQVRDFIQDNVVPKTRENIEDVLKALGLGYYDTWEIFKVVYTHHEENRWLNMTKIK